MSLGILPPGILPAGSASILAGCFFAGASFLLCLLFLLGRVDKKDSQSAIVMIQGWKLGANHEPRPDRHRSLGADRPIPAA
jgi:hypothetical protein